MSLVVSSIERKSIVSLPEKIHMHCYKQKPLALLSVFHPSTSILTDLNSGKSIPLNGITSGNQTRFSTENIPGPVP